MLVVTNDFPTRLGGIELFVRDVCRALSRPGGPGVVVLTAEMPGGAEYDRTCPFDVHRHPGSTLLPTRAVARHAAGLVEQYGCDRVLFGAAAPLGLLGAGLRNRGVRRVAALTHGHEAWWASVPLTRSALRRIGAGCDAVGYVSGWARDRLTGAIDAPKLMRVAPPIDLSRFPHPGGSGRPVVGTLSRMVPRKGHDALLHAWPQVVAQVPEAELWIAGDGPDRTRLRHLARRVSERVVDAAVDGSAGGAPGVIRFVGGVDPSRVPGFLAGLSVFAFPVRTRRFGLEAEALGIAALEAAAAGLAVVVGDSGGAPETVRPHTTGTVVHPCPSELAAAVVSYLRDPDLASAHGLAGRAYVAERFSVTAAERALAALLDCPVPAAPDRTDPD